MTKTSRVLIGFQIVSKDGKCNIPYDFHSFEVLSEEIADDWMTHHNDGSWKKVPVYEGDVEKPTFIK